jgi:hypothetical protein
MRFPGEKPAPLVPLHEPIRRYVLRLLKKLRMAEIWVPAFAGMTRGGVKKRPLVPRRLAKRGLEGRTTSFLPGFGEAPVIPLHQRRSLGNIAA